MYSEDKGACVIRDVVAIMIILSRMGELSVVLTHPSVIYSRTEIKNKKSFSSFSWQEVKH